MSRVFRTISVKTLITCYLFASMIFLVPSLRPAYGQPLVVVSEVSQVPSRVFAGDSFTETFNLTNVGDEEARMVQLSFDVSYPFAITGLSSEIFVGDLENGEARSISFELAVDKEVSVGIYYIPFTIKYKDYGGEDHIQEGVFNVQIFGKPQIFIRETIAGETPSRVFAGDSFTETFNLTNVGDEEARMVQLSFDVSYPFAVAGSSSNFFIGDLRQGESKSLRIEISVDRKAVGVYSIPFSISYEDPQGESHIKLGTLGIEVLGKPQIFIRETIAGETPSRVFAGDSFTETFNLTNVGDEEARMVQLSFDVSYPFAVAGSSSNFFIGDLRQGESKSLSIEISVDRKAMVGVYSIPFSISYEDAYGESYAKSGVTGVEILGKPQLLIDEINVDPSSMTPGQTGLMTVKTTNVGTDVARDASIKIFGGENLIASSFAYIANVDSKKSESILFPISLDSSLKPDTYLLNITIVYRDSFDNLYHLSRFYELKVSAIAPFIPDFYLYIAAGAATLALFGYFLYTWKPEDTRKEAKTENPTHMNANKGDPKPADLRQSNDLDTGHKEKSRLHNSRGRAGWKIFLVSTVIVLYAFFLIIYLAHTNLDNAGIIVYSNEVTIESLPGGVQEILRLRGLTKPVVLLVKHTKPDWVTMVITSEKTLLGTVVEMSDYIVSWRVNWRDFNLANQVFHRFAVANVRQLDRLESFIETLLSTQESQIIYDLSKGAFYGGPILVIFLMTLLLQGRLALWNLIAIPGFYSFEIYWLNQLAYKHYFTVPIEWEYFGYSFVVLLPLAIYTWHFERSWGGRSVANKMRALSRILGLLRK